MLPSLLPNLALYFSFRAGFNVDKGLCFVLLLLVFGILLCCYSVPFVCFLSSSGEYGQEVVMAIL